MAGAMFLQLFNQRHSRDCRKREYLCRYHRRQAGTSERVDHIYGGGVLAAVMGNFEEVHFAEQLARGVGAYP